MAENRKNTLNGEKNKSAIDEACIENSFSENTGCTINNQSVVNEKLYDNGSKKLKENYANFSEKNFVTNPSDDIKIINQNVCKKISLQNINVNIFRDSDINSMKTKRVKLSVIEKTPEPLPDSQVKVTESNNLNLETNIQIDLEIKKEETSISEKEQQQIKQIQQIQENHKQEKKFKDEEELIKRAEVFLEKLQKQLKPETEYIKIIAILSSLYENYDNTFKDKIIEVQKLISSRRVSTLRDLYSFMPLEELASIHIELCKCEDCSIEILRNNPLDSKIYPLPNTKNCEAINFLNIFFYFLKGEKSSIDLLKFTYQRVSENEYENFKEFLSRYYYLYKPTEERVGSYLVDKVTNKFRCVGENQTKPQRYNEWDELDGALQDLEDKIYNNILKRDRLLFYKEYFNGLIEGDKNLEVPVIFKEMFENFDESEKIIKFLIQMKESSKNQIKEEEKEFLGKVIEEIDIFEKKLNGNDLKQNERKHKEMYMKALKPRRIQSRKTQYFVKEDIYCKNMMSFFYKKMKNFLKERGYKMELVTFENVFSFFSKDKVEIEISEFDCEIFFSLFKLLDCLAAVRKHREEDPFQYRTLNEDEYEEMIKEFELLGKMKNKKGENNYEDNYFKLNLKYNYTGAPLVYFSTKLECFVKNKLKGNKKNKERYFVKIEETNTEFKGCTCCENNKMRLYKVQKIQKNKKV